MNFNCSIHAGFSYLPDSHRHRRLLRTICFAPSRLAFSARLKGSARKANFVWPGGAVVRKALSALSRFRNDEDGAALIEYTVLLGILLVAVVATIGVVG